MRSIYALRYGFNPNSSSLGADVAGLLLGAAMTFLITASLSVWIRIARRTKHGAAGVGETAGAAEE